MYWELKRVPGSEIDPRRIQSGAGNASAPHKSAQATGFDETLKRISDPDRKKDITISIHAAQRLMQRGITLDPADLERISSGFDRAAAKGAKESLFLLRDLALVVSVDNRTVITALQGEKARENVFTNIDSAILL